MRDYDELERLYGARPVAASLQGTVDLLVVRIAAGVHETPREAVVTPEHGMLGDRWSHATSHPAGKLPDPDRQLTLMMTSVAELVSDGQPLHLPGDNLLVNLNLSEASLPVGSRLRAGGALIQVTDKPHTGCKKFLARFGAGALSWINDERGRARRLRGLNCRVLETGVIRVGDAIEVLR